MRIDNSQLGFMVAAVGRGEFVVGCSFVNMRSQGLWFLSAGSVILGLERGHLMRSMTHHTTKPGKAKEAQSSTPTGDCEARAERVSEQAVERAITATCATWWASQNHAGHVLLYSWHTCAAGIFSRRVRVKDEILLDAACISVVYLW